jgi:LSD1 subclass zinc finger protein
MTDNTPMQLDCPSCGAPLEFDGTSSIVRCKFCKNIALVPGLPAAHAATPRASLDEVRQLVQSGKLADAIRRYSELYGADLKEAKDAVDALMAGKVVEVHRVFSGPLNAEETSRVLEEVKGLLRSGNKIGAIKRYREVNDVSLTQAKYVVDKVEAALTGGPIPPSPEIPVPQHPEVLGRPVPPSRPVKSRTRFGCVIALFILAIGGGILAYVLSRQGNSNPFVAKLNANGPAVLVSSGPGTPPDVASSFYNPDKDTRLIGLLDGTNGSLRWQTEPLAGDGYADAIAAGGDLVYTANGSTLLAYRKIDGSLAWQTQMPDKLNYGDLTLLVTAGRVITLNNDETLQAYDAITGSLVWNLRLVGNDNTLRLMAGSLVVLDYTTSDSYTYSLFFINPLDGSRQRLITPVCQIDQYSSDTLYIDSGLIYAKADNALYLVYDSSYGCIQHLDFTTGQVVWQTVTQDSFSFSPYGFSHLMNDTVLYFNGGRQLLALDKSTGTVQTLLANEDYDFIPLALSGDTLIVRARRTRGTERFELWGVNAATGKQVWQMVLQGASPIDPPNGMAGLVDDTDTGWTSRLLPTGLVLIKFQGAPNQIVLDTISPNDGTILGEQTVPLTHVYGDFYSIPSVIGWQDNVVYLSVESDIYALDVVTGKVLFDY